jgi:hypothetical protein
MSRLCLIFAITVFTGPIAASQPASSVFSASLGVESNYTNTSGDTWYSTWGDDGNLYVTSDDTLGVDSKCKTAGTRHAGNYVFVAIQRISGNDPSLLHVETINCMEDYDVPPDPLRNSPDNEGAVSWKTTGIDSIDGVLYLALGQDVYQDAFNRGRETAENATIIKSMDHGLTWTGSEAESVKNPLFPGRAFATPTFVQYGQDGKGTADGADRYVYAVSNNGSWDNGDTLILGRVLRTDLPRLRGTDWEFYAGSLWVGDPSQATPILRDQNRLGQPSVAYDPGLHRYLLASWSYASCTGYDAPGCDVHRTRWAFYQAPAPWGPWIPFQFLEWFPAGYYNPAFVSKFFSADGKRGTLFYAGYFWDPKWYLLTAAPIVLDLSPTRVINDNDPRAVTYVGQWNSARGMLGEYGGDLHWSADPAARAVVHFSGCGIRVVGDVATDLGTMNLEMDGKTRSTANAHYPRYGGMSLSQRVLWEAKELLPGDHELRISKRDGRVLMIDAFVVMSCGASAPK